MIIGAALLPHSPVLLDSIGKEQSKKLEKTKAAYAAVAARMAELKPDTIVIMSSHGTVYRDAFSLAVSDPYRAHFDEFGDCNTTFSARPDHETIDKLKRQMRKTSFKLALDTQHPLEYGFTVPLYFLRPLLKNTRLMPISHSGLDARSHYQFGVEAKEAFQESKRRLFLIASGDLSHRLTTEAPGGFSKAGVQFDEEVRTFLTQKNTVGLMQLDGRMVTEAAECGYRPLLMILGLLEKIPFETKLLSYEAPFGVGYLAVEFILP